MSASEWIVWKVENRFDYESLLDFFHQALAHPLGSVRIDITTQKVGKT